MNFSPRMKVGTLPYSVEVGSHRWRHVQSADVVMGSFRYKNDVANYFGTWMTDFWSAKSSRKSWEEFWPLGSQFTAGFDSGCLLMVDSCVSDRYLTWCGCTTWYHRSSGVVWQTVRVDPQFDRWRKTGRLGLLPVLILGVSYPSLSFKTSTRHRLRYFDRRHDWCLSLFSDGVSP